MRRHLTFDRIEAIMPDVDQLLAGHVTVGQWTLGAICEHLAISVNLTLDLPPADVQATREQTVYRRLFFRSPAFPEGLTAPLAIQIPRPDVDAATSSDSLRTALARLAVHQGPFPAHPVLGPMGRDEWLLFHARHAAHHLSFAIPTLKAHHEGA